MSKELDSGRDGIFDRVLGWFGLMRIKPRVFTLGGFAEWDQREALMQLAVDVGHRVGVCDARHWYQWLREADNAMAAAIKVDKEIGPGHRLEFRETVSRLQRELEQKLPWPERST